MPIAIYQVKSDTPALVGGSGTNGNLYFNNGDLVISAATKASNWTDWKVMKIESGPFVSEAQRDANLFASTGTLSIVMQKSPTTDQQPGTTMRSLDYSVGLTPATSNTFIAASGDWSLDVQLERQCGSRDEHGRERQQWSHGAGYQHGSSAGQHSGDRRGGNRWHAEYFRWIR